MQKTKNKLYNEIRSFRRIKFLYAIPLLFLGLLGLLLPIIPGILLLALGASMIFPLFHRKKSV